MNSTTETKNVGGRPTKRCHNAQKKGKFQFGHLHWMLKNTAKKRKRILNSPKVSVTDSSSSSNQNRSKPPPLKRVKLDVYNQALKTGNALRSYELPTKLRPEKRKSHIGDLWVSSENKKEFPLQGSVDENIIASIDKINEAIATFVAQHPNTCKHTAPQTRISKRQGLCISIKVSCKGCSFSTEDLHLYHNIKKGLRGPSTGTLNDRLVIPVLKTKVGVTDLGFVMSCLNIKCPGTSLMYEKVKQVASTMTEMNKQRIDM